MRSFILMILTVLMLQAARAQSVYEVNKGMVRFYSDAPHELIRAATQELKGAIDLKRKTFAFKVAIVSFMGFNSPLQREHFNENYMETTQYPEATFSGKIIEDTDLGVEGTYKVRAKGRLKIHGVEQERIIDVEVKNKAGKLVVQAEFPVLLGDHNIKIPKVVYDKLAPEIHVTVGASMVPLRK